LCIGSQRGRFNYGLVVATPELYQVGWRTSPSGISVYYERGQCFGVALSEQRFAFAGCSVNSRTKLQGRECYASATWPIFIGFLSVLTAFAARDMAAGMRQARNGRLRRCTACGYDLRATPDRCPECGRAAPGANVAVA
jgi:hypothetical protein